MVTFRANIQVTHARRLGIRLYHYYYNYSDTINSVRCFKPFHLNYTIRLGAGDETGHATMMSTNRAKVSPLSLLYSCSDHHMILRWPFSHNSSTQGVSPLCCMHIMSRCCCGCIPPEIKTYPGMSTVHRKDLPYRLLESSASMTMSAYTRSSPALEPGPSASYGPLLSRCGLPLLEQTGDPQQHHQ